MKKKTLFAAVLAAVVLVSCHNNKQVQRPSLSTSP